jgi:hypothetical protein
MVHPLIPWNVWIEACCTLTIPLRHPERKSLYPLTPPKCKRCHGVSVYIAISIGYVSGKCVCVFWVGRFPYIFGNRPNRAQLGGTDTHKHACMHARTRIPKPVTHAMHTQKQTQNIPTHNCNSTPIVLSSDLTDKPLLDRGMAQR